MDGSGRDDAEVREPTTMGGGNGATDDASVDASGGEASTATATATATGSAPTAIAFNASSPSVKRILREMRELREAERDLDNPFIARASEEDIFEWHFAVFGPPGTAFERGIYHGRIILPPEYPFKPPSFMLLTANGRFETNTKICLSISQHHPKQWQPSWSIRAALTAIRAFFPTPPEGAVGSLDWSDEVRRELAEKSWRATEPTFMHGNDERRALSASVHAGMLARMERVMSRELKSEKDADEAGPSGSNAAAVSAEEARPEVDVAGVSNEPRSTREEARSPTTRGEHLVAEQPVAAPAPTPSEEPAPSTATASSAERTERPVVVPDESPRPVTPDVVLRRQEERQTARREERERRQSSRAEELAKTKRQLDNTAWALVAAIFAITLKRIVIQSVIGALE